MSIDYRYELKYVYDENDYWSIIDKIMLHPYMFKEIYKMRKVCNIYLDTLEFKNYNDNLNGIKDRTKNRIRWYDDDTVFPILEYKNKMDKLGWKESFYLPELDLNNFNWQKYVDEIEQRRRSNPKYVQLIEDLKRQNPVLNNTYERRYFMSCDRKFRITVDKNLKYRKADRFGVGNRFINDDRVIVEIKFGQDDFCYVGNITQNLNESISANSKYVAGIDTIYFS